MGWKQVKEHYGITGPNRLVHVVNGEIRLGVASITDLMKISADGVLIKKDDVLRSADFTKYAAAMEADPAKLRELVLATDAFDTSLTVYTYDGGQIIEQKCEALGWPNVTHDGQLMYENTHSSDKAVVVEWARKNAAAGVSLCLRQVQRAEEDLAQAREWLAKEQEALATLDRDYPVMAADA